MDFLDRLGQIDELANKNSPLNMRDKNTHACQFFSSTCPRLPVKTTVNTAQLVADFTNTAPTGSPNLIPGKSASGPFASQG